MNAEFNSGQWQRLQVLFFQAAEMPAGDRQAFLDAHCHADLLLREEVDSLLRAIGPSEELLEIPSIRL